MPTWRRASIVTTQARDNWAENIIGRIIIPTILLGPPKDYWFSRYDFGEGERTVLFSYDPGPKSELIISRLCARFGYEVEFKDYDIHGDIGSTRFCIPKKDMFESAVRFLRECSNIVMTSLVQNGTEFTPARSDHDQNPHGSIFESYHHMFWNITQCPMHVFVNVDGETNSIKIGTRWTMRPSKEQNHKELEIHY